eukprot:15451049-Alexandrium_andersonii.AAC.1
MLDRQPQDQQDDASAGHALDIAEVEGRRVHKHPQRLVVMDQDRVASQASKGTLARNTYTRHTHARTHAHTEGLRKQALNEQVGG